MLIFFSILLFSAYALLIIYYTVRWKKIPTYQAQPILQYVNVSIIIPARNEEENINQLLSSLTQQTYPDKYIEIIVIDDNSTDNTAAIVKMFPQVKLISFTESGINSYKKKALETGIKEATGEWIITTDADCIPSAEWVATLISFQEQKESVLVAAPVRIDYKPTSFVQLFQAMDFMVLQGITGAVVHSQTMTMGNGANLAYKKKAFETVNGFSGIDDIASGDDMLLMYKIANAFPGKIHYLKSKKAIVDTQPVLTWKDFFNQRIRWASKAAKYNDKRILPVLLLVYLFNLCFPVLLIASFWNSSLACLAGLLLGVKTLVELPFFISVSQFFNQRKLAYYFFFFQPIHIIYTLFSGLLGQFGSYQWKGRQVK